MTGEPLSLELPADLLDALAVRVADLLEQRGHGRAETDDRFVNVDAAAAYLSCPASRVYALVSANRIPHHRDGSRLLFLPSELRAYVANGGATRP